MDNKRNNGCCNYIITSSEMKEALSELVGTPNDAAAKENAVKIIQAQLEKRFLTKTDGEGNLMVVDNPDYVAEDGSFRKHRKKNTDKRPKVKRKKNKKTHR